MGNSLADAKQLHFSPLTEGTKTAALQDAEIECTACQNDIVKSLSNPGISITSVSGGRFIGSKEDKKFRIGRLPTQKLYPSVRVLVMMKAIYNNALHFW